MREIKHIVCHCTATDQNAKVDAILNYWRTRLGWKNPGYHFLIEANGKIHNLQPISKLSNGVAGYNANSIHVSYIGGKDEDDRTDAQKRSMLAVVMTLSSMYPNAIIQGHRDFLQRGKPGWKECPRFDAIEEFSDYQPQV